MDGHNQIAFVVQFTYKYKPPKIREAALSFVLISEYLRLLWLNRGEVRTDRCPSWPSHNIILAPAAATHITVHTSVLVPTIRFRDHKGAG